MRSLHKELYRISSAPILVSVFWSLIFACGHTVLEWLFFTTKPSFLNAVVGWRNYLVPVRVMVLLAIIIIGAYVLIWIVRGLLSRLLSWSGSGVRLFSAIPAMLATASALIAIDNFSYTLFGYGIVFTRSSTIMAYWILLFFLFRTFYRFMRSKLQLASKSCLGIFLPLLFLIYFGLTLAYQLLGHGLTRNLYTHAPTRGSNGLLPNIILFGSDGINAERLLIYGYKRETAPNLSKFFDRGLMVDNAFPNGPYTAASLTALLTGKFPTTTKVVYEVDMLAGHAAYEHLPGILKSLGYSTFQETIRRYADSKSFNFKNGFDLVNQRRLDSDFESSLQFVRDLIPDSDPEFALIANISERITERLLHLLGQKKMQLPFLEMDTEPNPALELKQDDQRIARAIKYIETVEGPFFIHLHLMDSHCCKYNPTFKHFSENILPPTKEDLYDDLVLSSDYYFGQLISALERLELLEDTIVIYYSDHGRAWSGATRVPLLFRFPDFTEIRHVSETSQLIDVAPTLLDYLDQPVPVWMEGVSLLSNHLPPLRPVIGTVEQRKPIKPWSGSWSSRSDKIGGPPYFHIFRLRSIFCQRAYYWDLKLQQIDTVKDLQHTAPCAEANLPSKEQVQQVFIEHLQQRGIGETS